MDRRWWGVAAAALGALSAGCGDDAASSGGPTLEYELFDNTVELDEETLDALSDVGEDQATLTFTASTPQLERLAPPNVLLAGATAKTPRGLLRRVTSVDRSGSGVVVETTPATVFHAFRRLDVDMEVPIGEGAGDFVDAPPERGPGAAAEALTVSLPIGVTDFPLELFDGDENEATQDDRVAGTATLMATVGVHFWLHFDWETKTVEEAFDALGDLLEEIGSTLIGDSPSLGELLNLRTGLTVTGDLEAALDLHGKSSLGYETPMPLGGYPLAEIPIGPLVFIPSLSFEAHFSGGVTGEMTMGFGVEAHTGLGYSYDADEGSDPFVIPPTFTFQEPSPIVTIDAEVRAELEMKLHFDLYGLMGPYVSLKSFAHVDVDRSRMPCWRLTAGLEGDSGASIRIFGEELADFDGPSFPLGDPLELAEGACEPLPEPAPTDAVITPWSRSYGDTIWSAGTDEGWTDLELAHDGRLLLTGSGGLEVVKVKEDGSVVWARTFDEPSRPSTTQLWPQHATPTLDAAILVATRQNVIVKLDQAGHGIWAAHVETDNLEPGWWTARQVTGDVWLAGTYRPEGTDDRQAWLLVLGPDGHPKSSWTWGVADHHEAVRGILPLEDGGLLVGQAVDFTGDTRGFVMRVASDGSVRWAKSVDSCTDEEPILVDAQLSIEGNLLIAGYFYETNGRALLFRMAPDGSDDAPAWATATSIPLILGLEPRSILQLSTGELRVTGRWARASGADAVFVAGTDSIGRFAWLRWYGGDSAQGPATARITTQGGLLVAATTATPEPDPGGFWLFEVPMADGAIGFDAASGLTSEPLTFTSAASCLVTPDASTATTPLPVGMTSAVVDVIDAAPPVRAH